jgi:hypothetical protein
VLLGNAPPHRGPGSGLSHLLLLLRGVFKKNL